MKSPFQLLLVRLLTRNNSSETLPYLFYNIRNKSRFACPENTIGYAYSWKNVLIKTWYDKSWIWLYICTYMVICGTKFTLIQVDQIYHDQGRTKKHIQRNKPFCEIFYKISQKGGGSRRIVPSPSCTPMIMIVWGWQGEEQWGGRVALTFAPPESFQKGAWLMWKDQTICKYSVG